MDRSAIFVDAGYFLSQAVKIVSIGTSRHRTDLELLDAAGLIGLLRESAISLLSNSNILRTYWYDGVSGGLSSEHRKIVAVDDVQLRPGTINYSGKQKGVDSRIVTDLVELASNHAISDAIVVSGDADISVGIELAMHKGVRVAVLGLEDKGIPVLHCLSSEIMQLADRVGMVTGDKIKPFFSYKPKTQFVPHVAPETIQASSPMSDSHPAINTAVIAFIAASATPFSRESVMGASGILPDIDRKLLFSVFQSLGKGALTVDEKRYLRAEFLRYL